MNVVFLGGPVDGLELSLSNDPPEFRFPQKPRVPNRMLTPEELQQALPRTYVAYRKTGRTINGRRIYSLVISRD